MAAREATRLDAKIKLATLVSRRVDLESIRIMETSARRKLQRNDLPSNISVAASVQTDADKKQSILNVLARCTLVARYDDTLSGEFLRIEAAFLLCYRLESFAGLRKANLTAFGETNAIYNAWPYWREYVQSTTVRMGLPPLTVPVYRPILDATRPLHSERMSKKPARRARKQVRLTRK